jgi:hypothetical protein
MLVRVRVEALRLQVRVGLIGYVLYATVAI